MLLFCSFIKSGFKKCSKLDFGCLSKWHKNTKEDGLKLNHCRPHLLTTLIVFMTDRSDLF